MGMAKEHRDFWICMAQDTDLSSQVSWQTLFFKRSLEKKQASSILGPPWPLQCSVVGRFFTIGGPAVASIPLSWVTTSFSVSGLMQQMVKLIEVRPPLLLITLTNFKSSNALKPSQIFLGSLKTIARENIWSIYSHRHPLGYMWIFPSDLNLFSK